MEVTTNENWASLIHNLSSHNDNKPKKNGIYRSQSINISFLLQQNIENRNYTPKFRRDYHLYFKSYYQNSTQNSSQKAHKKIN